MALAAAAAAVVAIVATLASPRALAQPSPGAYRLVVHPSNPVRDADRNFVAQMFLKRVTRWPNGDPIEPVDLDQRSPVRRRFSNEVLNRSVDAVKTYWQQMIFSGRALPPPEVTTDDQVISFVLHRPGSIGYVSAGANLHGAHEVIIR
jgi:ABC-type phosphate transport system substrate-binding protein